MPIDEFTAIKKVLGGDKQAFRPLVEANSRLVFTAVLRIVRDEGAAEDIAQDAFLQAYRSLASFRGEAAFSTWLARIAVNKALDYCRVQARLAELPADLPAFGLGPEGSILAKEEVWQLRDQVRALPPLYRRTISQFYYRGLSYQEIALAEGVSVKTVESRLYRAKEMLRKSIGGGEGNVLAPRP